MNQLDIFQDAPAGILGSGGTEGTPPNRQHKPSAGRGSRQASRDAYSAMRDAGKLQPNEQKVLAFLKAHPGQPFTRAEIAHGTGMTQGAACGRFDTLRKLGLAHEVDRKTCSVTGSSAAGIVAA